MAGRDNNELARGRDVRPRSASRPREWHCSAATSGRGGECGRSGCKEQRGHGQGEEREWSGARVDDGCPNRIIIVQITYRDPYENDCYLY